MCELNCTALVHNYATKQWPHDFYAIVVSSAFEYGIDLLINKLAQRTASNRVEPNRRDKMAFRILHHGIQSISIPRTVKQPHNNVHARVCGCMCVRLLQKMIKQMNGTRKYAE